MNDLPEKPNLVLDPEELKTNFNKNRFYAKLESSEVDVIINSKRRFIFRHYAVPVLKRLLTSNDDNDPTDATVTKRLNELLMFYVDKYGLNNKQADKDTALYLFTLCEDLFESEETKQYFLHLFFELISECFKCVNQFEPKTLRYFNMAVEENTSHCIVNIELI